MKTRDQRLGPRGEARILLVTTGDRGNDGAFQPTDDHILQRIPLIMGITGIRAGAAASAKSGAGISMLKTPRLKARRPRRFAADVHHISDETTYQGSSSSHGARRASPVSLHPDMLGRGARRPGFDDDGGHRGHGCLDIMARRQVHSKPRQTQ